MGWYSQPQCPRRAHHPSQPAHVTTTYWRTERPPAVPLTGTNVPSAHTPDRSFPSSRREGTASDMVTSTTATARQSQEESNSSPNRIQDSRSGEKRVGYNRAEVPVRKGPIRSNIRTEPKSCSTVHHRYHHDSHGSCTFVPDCLQVREVFAQRPAGARCPKPTKRL